MQLLILWILLQIWPTKAGLGDNNNGGIQEPAAEYLAEPGSYERLIEDTDGVRRHNLPTWTFYQITEEDIQQPLSEPVHSEEVNTVNKDVKQIGFGSTKRSQLKRRQRGKHRQLLPHNFNFHNNNNYSGRKWKEETHRNLTQLVHTLRREDPLTLSSLSVRHGIHRWRVKRDAPDDAFSPLRTRRRKRELDVDTRVGLIVGAVVLGVLAATLLICACIRCNAVRKSADGKSMVPDYTPTVFAVPKGYDNVAFDMCREDPKPEKPTNDIPMTETATLSGGVNTTVSVA